MLRELAYSLIGLVILAYALDHALGLRDDAREPPRVRPRIPLIGHVLGIVKFGAAYYNHTSARANGAEIYTVDILATKIYVNNSRRLMPPIQKASRTLSFRPFVTVSARKIAGNSEAACALFASGPLVEDFSHAIRAALLPGPQVDEQNLRMGREGLVEVGALVAGGEGKRFRLLEWTRHVVVQASSCGLFGMEHPFRGLEAEEAFWEWQRYLPMHMANLDLFGRAAKARDVVHNEFYSYCAALPADVSPVVRERQRVLKDAGMGPEDLAKQETSFCVAIFGNTVPTLFWTIWELFTRPGLLTEVREEILAYSVSRNSGGQEKEEEEGGGAEKEAVGSGDEFVLDVAALKTKCPLLLAVFQETQRLHHVHANIRKVVADTLLDDGRYLLRKGNYLQMPGSPIHVDAGVWGPSAAEFDPYRFLGGGSSTTTCGKGTEPGGAQAPSAQQPSSFLAWGAPPHLCPARQFASAEILLVVALLAVRVELVPATADGRWESLVVDYHGINAVCDPAKDVEIYARPRAQGSGTWGVKMGGSSTRISLASG